MMTRVAIFITAVLFILVANLAADEIYKYRDADGVVRYTYDLGEVPEDQRSDIQTFEEEAISVTESSPAGQNDEPSEAPEAKPTEDASPIADDQKIEELNQKKKELDQEFAGLMEEKYNLLKEKQRLGSLPGSDTKAADDYDKRANELNRKITDYQNRQEAFRKEVEAVKKAREKPGN
jgi:predicted RNase H-like nuclease (RuvC/YqgF family)